MESRANQRSQTEDSKQERMGHILSLKTYVRMVTILSCKKLGERTSWETRRRRRKYVFMLEAARNIMEYLSYIHVRGTSSANFSGAEPFVRTTYSEPGSGSCSTQRSDGTSSSIILD